MVIKTKSKTKKQLVEQTPETVVAELIHPEIPPKPPEIKTNLLKWEPPAKAKTVLRTCIVVDHNNNWNEGIKLDLSSYEPSEIAACTKGYYGQRYPILVEVDGYLKPFIQTDRPGESPHKTYIAAKATGYKGYMKIVNSLLQKIQIGLMALLVVGILFLIYILINRNGG